MSRMMDTEEAWLQCSRSFIIDISQHYSDADGDPRWWRSVRGPQPQQSHSSALTYCVRWMRWTMNVWWERIALPDVDVAVRGRCFHVAAWGNQRDQRSIVCTGQSGPKCLGPCGQQLATNFIYQSIQIYVERNGALWQGRKRTWASL